MSRVSHDGDFADSTDMVHPRLIRQRHLLLVHPSLKGSWRSGRLDPKRLRATLTSRNLLSIDPKNLDADAELRRFFGSKVVSDCNHVYDRS